MTTTMLLQGAELTLDPSGALWWPKARTLVAADLHFEKGSAFAMGGRMLPPYDTRTGIERLAVVLRRYRPNRFIALGDSFHDMGARARMSAPDAERLAEMVKEHDWVWVCGNHDPVPPQDLGGRVVDELELDALVFRHEPAPGEQTGEVVGHFHPKAAVRVRGRRISGRAFVTDGTRLVLPAFGAYAGGLDALDPALTCLFSGTVRVYLIGRDGIFLFPAERLEGFARDGALAAR